MTLTLFWEIVGSVLVSLGGVAALIRFGGGFIAKYLSEQYKLKFDKDLEKYIDALNQKNHISKVQFDMEIMIYRELSEKILDMIETNSKLYVENIAMRNNQPFDLDRFRHEAHDRAFQAYHDANRAININAFFIPQELYVLFDDIRKKCYQQIIDFRCLYLYETQPSPQLMQKDAEELKKQAEEITKKQKEIILTMREYLDKLKTPN